MLFVLNSFAAMKKRGRDSISPHLLDSKKPNSSKFDVTRKLKASKVVINLWLFKFRHFLSFTFSSGQFNLLCLAFVLKKQGGSDKCLKPTVSMPITKEEEEVADALYALSGMFFHNKANDKSKENQESSEANPSDLPQSKGSHKPTIEGFLRHFLLHDCWIYMFVFAGFCKPLTSTRFEFCSCRGKCSLL